jgi:DNA-binding transcriptional ArsR family regulator
MVERSALLDRTYGALSHEIRRQMLEQLKGGPARVTELASPFDVSLASASKHIRVLEDAGLVARTIRGRDHLLSVQADSLGAAREWIDTYTAFWAGRLDALEAELRKG